MRVSPGGQKGVRLPRRAWTDAGSYSSAEPSEPRTIPTLLVAS